MDFIIGPLLVAFGSELIFEIVKLAQLKRIHFNPNHSPYLPFFGKVCMMLLCKIISPMVSLKRWITYVSNVPQLQL